PKKMVEKRNGKTIRVANSQVGVIGDNARISGGVHFHHYPRDLDDADQPENSESSGESTAFDPAAAADILHLSDLHFGAEADSDPMAAANRWFGGLTDDLRKELDCRRLHAVIISGDIGNFSLPEEYRAAEIFLERLRVEFRLDASRIIIAPGNHDLNWKIAKKGYHLIDEEEHDKPLREGQFIRVDEEVIRLRDDKAYALRFRHFSKFHQNATDHPYPFEPKEQATLHHLPELNLLICGFNSVWEADHHFRTRISINPDAVAFALDRIREGPELKNCLKFAVWHHPLSSPHEDRIKDSGFMQRLAQSGFHACLHGHIHKTDAGLFRYDMSADGRRIHIIGAGAFGAPVKEWTPGYPLQYNLLRLSGNTLRVVTRRRIELNGAWEPDHMWRQGKGQPNLPHYDIPLPIGAPSKPTSEPGPSEQVHIPPADSSLEAEIRAYRAKAESLHDSLPVAGFATHLKTPIDIEDIYIPLRAMVNLKGVDDFECYGDARDAEKRLSTCDAGLEIPLIDAFSQAGMRDRKGLVILGDPGSGKTTHMKRLLLWCLRQGPETMGLPDGMLPV
ncbi:MAG: hypothetical protein GY859_27665, partial [Desulfobacterales bacterium]|nr:hypothetical protein [Desulfobacterales bacterium]